MDAFFRHLNVDPKGFKEPRVQQNAFVEANPARFVLFIDKSGRRRHFGQMLQINTSAGWSSTIQFAEILAQENISGYAPFANCVVATWPGGLAALNRDGTGRLQRIAESFQTPISALFGTGKGRPGPPNYPFEFLHTGAIRRILLLPHRYLNCVFDTIPPRPLRSPTADSIPAPRRDSTTQNGRHRIRTMTQTFNFRAGTPKTGTTLLFRQIRDLASESIRVLSRDFGLPVPMPAGEETSDPVS